MADQVAAIIADLARYTADEVIALTLDVDERLRLNTPRDTGWAAANWVPSIGTPVTIPQLDGKASPADVGRAARQAAASAAALNSYTIEQGATFVSNGVPYLPKLNEGHSQQAPAAFIEACVVQAVAARIGR